jgi:DNA polymerase III alpha subunit
MAILMFWRARVEKELKVIDELKFSGYFLINWDIIQYKQYGIHAYWTR